MKSTQLRLGNIVGLATSPTVIDHVLMLEPGMVHLESGKEYEDEENIQEVPIRESILGRFGIPANNWFYLGGVKMYIGLPPGIKDAQLHIDKLCFRVRYMHELQNLILDHTGHELITHPNIHKPYGQN
jgi:hypothetical protein